MESNKEQTPESAPTENTTPVPPCGPAVTPPATIKEFRSRLDMFLNSLPLLHLSAEMTLAKRSLQMSFSWLGKALKEQGSKTPYTSSEDPGSSHIEPLADHNPRQSLANVFENIDETHTARVKAFRAKMTEYIKEFTDFLNREINNLKETDENRQYGWAIFFSLKSAKEAKIWMGWELGRIRDYMEAKANSLPATDAALPL